MSFKKGDRVASTVSPWMGVGVILNLNENNAKVRWQLDGSCVIVPTQNLRHAYDPFKDGYVRSVHIWINDKGSTIATLNLSYGNSVDILWAKMSARKEYFVGIDGDTIFSDDRAQAA